MTTVVWRAGVLAADKKASQDDVGWKVTKLFRTKTHAIAFAGDLGVGVLFVKWFRGGQEGECPLNDDTCALVMDLETGACEQWEHPGVGIPIEDKFATMGSGSCVAIGALSMGATAIEAVEIACEWDNGSGLGLNYAKSKKAKRGPTSAPKQNK